MSLETKIEELTAAVNMLTETILKSDIGTLIKEQAEQIDKAVKDTTEAAQKEPAKKAKAEKPEQEPKQEADSPTVDSIKSYCMKLVREDGTKKQPIRDVLAEYGAKTVDKVPSDKLSELMTKLETL